MKQFHGTLDQLRDTVQATGIVGEWSEVPANGPHCFKAKTGEVLNWWPNKGTVQLQGKNQEEFRRRLASAQPSPSNAPLTTLRDSSKIFVVHGHDRDARDQLELILMRLELQPFILQNQDGGSKTIIEALEQHIYKEAAFGIVLLTPDDYGYPRTKSDADRQARARQNVILEMGMVMAALGRDRMVILKKGALELPSDAAGILYIEFNDHVREIVPKLAQRLQSAGFNIDPQKIAAASA
jgi:predicted nucleotide-binding protein